MTNNNPNFHIPLLPPSNQIIPIYPNPNLQFTLSPSYDRNPNKKPSKTSVSSSSSSRISKPKYTKKPDPNAPKITRPCTECGKKFWSWKALFGHMRCHPERQWRGINPPPNHRGDGGATVANSSSKQRTSNWISCMTEEDHEVASYLIMLSNGTLSSSTSSSRCERFECGVCKKVFGSHQALGGHRASHKNVKGCFAITNVIDHHDHPMMMVTTSSDHHHHHGKIVTFSGYHKCNICFRVFTSGQALGGHMRCHWEREDETMNFVGALDLNVPVTVDDDDDLSTLDTSGCSLDLRLRL